MAEKLIKTKIALKQNTYEYWTDNTVTPPAEKKAGAGEGKYYVPLFGEVCFCEITAAGQGTQTTPPTVLFKVGNGKDYFKDLNWASALAADVYDWAKLSWTDFVKKFEAGAELDVSVVNGNITYSHESKLGKSYTTSVPTNTSATAFADTVTIKVPKLTVNQYGHVTAAEDTEYTISIPTPEAASNTVTTLEEGDGITIEDTKTDGNHNYVVSHQVAPTTGNKATVQTGGTGRTYVTEVLVDELGHIAGVKTATETDQTIPDSPSISIGDKTDTDTDNLVYAVTNLVESGTLNHTITPTYKAVPTKKYVDDEIAAKVASAVQYLGTVSAAANLGKNESGTTITIGKGDFYRASAAFTLGSETVHVGDMLIAIVDNPGTTAANWDVAHLEIDTNTWTANSDTAAGYVAATGGTTNAGKVWKVGSDGKPAWLTDTDTDTHHQAKNIVGTSATATANGAVTGTGGVYLNLIENSTVRSTHKIVGTGATTVKSDSSGNITINTPAVTDTNTWRNINVFAGVEGSKASVFLKGTGITTGALNLKAGTGLKWTATANSNDATVDIDDTVTFILDCN